MSEKTNTLCVIKPNAVADNRIGVIVKRFEEEGMRVAALRMTSLTRRQVEAFYEEHVGKDFFDRLADFMTSGPVCAMVLEGENAVERVREIMGATNPEKAQEGTLRKLYGENMTKNAVHGSDSDTSAKREIDFYFAGFDIF